MTEAVTLKPVTFFVPLREPVVIESIPTKYMPRPHQKAYYSEAIAMDKYKKGLKSIAINRRNA